MGLGTFPPLLKPPTLLSAAGLPDEDVRRDATATTVSTYKGKHLASPLEDQSQLILSLTVMYLDRATSQDNLHIDPSTGQPWHPSCPYVFPQLYDCYTWHLFLLPVVLASM